MPAGQPFKGVLFDENQERRSVLVPFGRNGQSRFAMYRQASIPPRYRDKGFEDFICPPGQNLQARVIGQAKKYADQFARIREKGSGLLILGNTGTGKTHIACAILSSALKQGFSGIFTSVQAMMREVKESYKAQGNGNDAVSKYTYPDLLVIDEIGVQAGTEHERVILCEVINRRYEEIKPSILISNFESEKAREYLGDRIIDRLMEGGGGELPFVWESYRSKA